MEYNRCTAITPINKSKMFDSIIIYNNNLYKVIGTGVSGRTYVSVDKININGDFKKCLIKIIPPYDTDAPYNENMFDKEVELQKIAAKYGIGPTIYKFKKNIDPFSLNSPFKFQKNSYFCQFKTLHYILMEYYDTNDGWRHIELFELKNHTIGICNLLRRLILQGGIINRIDPRNHFYFHIDYNFRKMDKNKGYRMIDYGAAEKIDKNDIDNIMTSLEDTLLIKCPTINNMNSSNNNSSNNNSSNNNSSNNNSSNNNNNNDDNNNDDDDNNNDDVSNKKIIIGQIRNLRKKKIINPKPYTKNLEKRRKQLMNNATKKKMYKMMTRSQLKKLQNKIMTRSQSQKIQNIFKRGGKNTRRMRS
jgi:hypothetical protein